MFWFISPTLLNPSRQYQYGSPMTFGDKPGCLHNPFSFKHRLIIKTEQKIHFLVSNLKDCGTQLNYQNRKEREIALF